MNDEERRLWVLNDEGLYNWWQSEKCGLTVFIRRYRQELTQLINRALGKGDA